MATITEKVKCLSTSCMGVVYDTSYSCLTGHQFSFELLGEKAGMGLITDREAAGESKSVSGEFGGGAC